MADVLTRRETARPERISPPSTRPPRHRRFGAAVVALLSVLAIGLGVSMGEGQARAVSLPTSTPSPTGAIGDVIAALANNGVTQVLAKQWRFDLCSSDSDGGPTNGGADCTGSTGTGVAVVLPTTIDLVPDAVYTPAQALFNVVPSWLAPNGKFLGVTVPVPDAALPEGSAKVIGDGFQFALASGGGKATAISYLPLSLATAGASDGRTAYAFAIVGMANAWTTSAIPIAIFTIPTGTSIPPIKNASCYGVLTAAYAENVGACANVLGTFDFKLDQLQSIPQVQFALTDPTAVVFNPAQVLATALGKFVAGQGFTLSKDFTRLSLGGDSLLALTSDYGLSAPITVNWLGSTITIYPTATINGATRPNMLALPQIVTGDLDTSQIIPIITIPQITFPFGLAPLGPYVSSTPALTTTSARTLAATKTTTSRAARIAATDAETGATSSSSSTTTSSTTPSTATSSSTTSTTVSSSSSTSRTSQSSSSSGARTSAPSAAPTSSAGTDTGTDSGGTQSSGGVPAASPAG